MVLREQLINFQYDDISLDKLRKFTDPKIKGEQSVYFKEKAGHLYHVLDTRWQTEEVNYDKQLYQVI